MRDEDGTTPAPQPERIVDAHVHLWDPARADWYPYLSGGRDLGMGDTSGMARRFDVGAHRAESSGWPVTALVNVAAAVGHHSVAETLGLDRLADHDPSGQPSAIVGGLPPGTVGEVIAMVDDQMAAARLRGVRPMGGSPDPLPPTEVLTALAERGLVLEVMAHPDRLLDAARGLEAHDDLTVVVEHTGWPRSDTDEERALWSEGMAALAGLGPHVHCKLSGLAMSLGRATVEAFAPWFEPALELSGPHRCLFASNFPVEGMHTSLDGLLSVCSELTAGLAPTDRAAVFATTAERVYRLPVAPL